MWVVLRSGGFESAEEAKKFGARLKQVFAIASLSCRLGVDVGSDRATTTFHGDGPSTSNFHGLSIHVESENLWFPLIEMTATVQNSTEDLIQAMDEASAMLSDLTSETENALYLFNRALTSPNFYRTNSALRFDGGSIGTGPRLVAGTATTDTSAFDR